MPTEKIIRGFTPYTPTPARYGPGGPLLRDIRDPVLRCTLCQTISISSRHGFTPVIFITLPVVDVVETAVYQLELL